MELCPIVDDMPIDDKLLSQARSNLNWRMKPNMKNGTQKWSENWAFYENGPWGLIFMLPSIFDSFSFEN